MWQLLVGIHVPGKPARDDDPRGGVAFWYANGEPGLKGVRSMPPETAGMDTTDIDSMSPEKLRAELGTIVDAMVKMLVRAY